ncbi:amphi-Trp domain-containing protein [Natrinema salaciae]|uniref:Amphi-Trp domain-containing protein n=1 Tax=Natrinema salaciae TaxID=1186196 RepID=A0A1H9Q3H8_9EURY|nr:amphi-Trp domain-containing protein [Natrinema salaciae]SER54984.1 amphi-Trp domain-containing protein [Natrinema salaciae]
MNDSPDDANRPDDSDAADEDEFKLERAYDRAALATVFREFATAFETGQPVRLNGDDRSVGVAVPERVVAEFEAGHDAVAEPPVAELEVELEWDDPDDSSVRIAERDAASDADADGDADAGADADADADDDRVRTDAADVDPAAAVMPLEGVTDRGGREDEADAAEDADGAADGETGRTSRFEVYEDRAGQWRWRLVHWNGNIVADSGEGYASRSNAERAARSVMRSAPTATVERRE